jgi:hypothetical protein
MSQAEFERRVGAENICPSITEAIERAAEVYQRDHSGAALDENKSDHNGDLIAKSQ